jgi:hypothetical protein
MSSKNTYLQNWRTRASSCPEPVILEYHVADQEQETVMIRTVALSMLILLTGTSILFAQDESSENS